MVPGASKRGVAVPELVGKPLQEAKELVARDGFVLDVVESHAPQAKVSIQKPAPGKLVLEGTRITAWRCKPETVPPGIVGANCKDAEAMAIGAGAVGLVEHNADGSHSPISDYSATVEALCPDNETQFCVGEYIGVILAGGMPWPKEPLARKLLYLAIGVAIGVALGIWIALQFLR